MLPHLCPISNRYVKQYIFVKNLGKSDKKSEEVIDENLLKSSVSKTSVSYMYFKELFIQLSWNRN